MKEAERRRLEELEELKEQGLPVTAISRWHWKIDETLEIFTQTGRWINLKTRQWGRAGRTSVRELIKRVQ